MAIEFTSKIGTHKSRLGRIIVGDPPFVFTDKLGTRSSHLATFKLGIQPPPGGVVYSRSVSNTLTISQSAVTRNILSIIGHNTLVFNQSAVTPIVWTRSVSNTLTFSQSTSLIRIVNISVSNHVTYTQTVTVRRVINLTASNILNFTQVAIKPFILASASNSLVLSHTAIASKLVTLSVSNRLNMTQFLFRNVVFNRTVSNTLVFIHDFIYRSLGTFFNRHEVEVTVVPRTRVVVLETDTSVIVLPTPLLGDSQIYTGGSIAIKHSINGQPMILMKQTDLQKLKYTFALNRLKSIELRQFIVGNLTKLITLFNWKGELWKVYIVNSPLELIAKSRWADDREEVDITLELEGIKLSG